jgi:hypothetical protein
MSGMDFSDALRLVKQGRRVRRAVWVPYMGAAMGLAHARVGDQDMPFLAVWYSDGRVVPFAGAIWDLLSEDWEEA